MTSEINKNRNSDFNEILIFIAILFFGLALGGTFFQNIAGKASYLLTEMSILILFSLFLRKRGYSLKKQFRWNPVPVSSFKYILLLSVGATFLFDELDRLMSLIMPIPEESYRMLLESLSFENFGEAFLIFSGVCIVAPFVEESLFRGFLQQRFERNANPTKAVLITSLIFSLFHLTPWWIAQLLIFAVFLGYFAWFSGSVLPSIIIHICYNTWSLYLMQNPDSKILDNYLWHNQVNPVLIIVSILLVRYGGIRFQQTISKNRN